MIHETILAIIIAFAISALLCPIIIPFLHKLKFGQQVRDDGPQSHLKAGNSYHGRTDHFIQHYYHIPVLYSFLSEDHSGAFMTAGFGIIGFLDDYIKIILKRSEGLTPLQKLAGQIVITGILPGMCLTAARWGTDMLIPFTGGFEDGKFLSLGILFVPALFL